MPKLTRRTFLSVSFLAAAGLAVVGCAPSDSPEAGAPLAQPVDPGRTLIAYFSVPLADTPDGMNRDQENSTHVVDGEVLGNTQYVAQLIQARLGAEVFRIETAEPLPLEFDILEAQALAEQEAGTRPELGAVIDNLDDYDTVFVGYPIFWYDIPMPLYTFFEQHDFAGKTIIPFSTHGGSRLSGTVEVISELLPNSTVSGNAFTISRDDMADAASEVGSWLDSLA